MLTIQESFGAFLLTAPSLVGLLPNPLIPNDEGGSPAIYPVRGRQDSKVDPYIVWRFVEYRETPEVGGPPVIADCRVEVGCYSAIYDTANAVAGVIQQLFRSMSPDTTGIPGGPQVLWSGVVNTVDGEITETGMYEVVIEIGLQIDLEIQGS